MVIKKLNPKDFTGYNERLAVQLRNMSDDINQGIFDHKNNKIGQELELVLYDKDAKPAIGYNKKVIKSLEGVPKNVVDSELGSWNLEIRTKPKILEDGAFYAEEKEMLSVVSSIRKAAQKFGLKVGMTGTAETLTDQMLQNPLAMTPETRYKWLIDMILKQRGSAIDLNIEGQSGKKLVRKNITTVYETGSTASQQHLQVKNTQNIPDYLNASMILAAPLVAITANAPFILGDGPFWDESRVVMFEQCTDLRTPIRRKMNYPKRCGMGTFFYKDTRDFFNTISILFDPLIPSTIQKLSLQSVHRRNTHLLDLRLLATTAWWWVRPIIEYTPRCIRIENRIMSAGPTVRDNMANSVLYWGAVYGLVKSQHPIKNWKKFSFTRVRKNFYNAAKFGNDVDIYWVSDGGKVVQDKPFNIIEDFVLPNSESALELFDIPTKERNQYLNVIKKRLKTQMSPTKWKIKEFTKLTDRGKDPYEALQQIVKKYIKAGEINKPLI